MTMHTNRSVFGTATVRVALGMRTRRGNTLVLVTAILVLLVIIATAYITRAQGGRVIAAAQRKAIDREDRSQLAVGVVANEIASNLLPEARRRQATTRSVVERRASPPPARPGSPGRSGSARSSTATWSIRRPSTATAIRSRPTTSRPTRPRRGPTGPTRRATPRSSAPAPRTARVYDARAW